MDIERDIPQHIKDILFKKERTWDDFGVAWEWAIKQEWFDVFCGSKPHKAWTYPIGLINPDRFADAVYEFLKEGR